MINKEMTGEQIREANLLDKLLIYKVSDHEALGRIFSHYIDIGGNFVGLTVENAIKAGKLLRLYDKAKKDKERRFKCKK